LFAVSVLSPMAGLLAASALTPAGQNVFSIGRIGTFSIADAIVVPFLTAWLLRADAERDGPRAPRGVGWLIAIALFVAGGAQMRAGNRDAVIAAARVLAGMALAAATIVLFRRHPVLAVRLPVALAISAVVALAGMSRDRAPGALVAMIVCLAAGMSVRDHGSRRAAWGAAASLLLVSFTSTTVRDVRTASGVPAAVGGLAALWIVVAIAPAVRACVRSPADARLIGVTCGVLAFVAIAVATNRWPTAAVVYPFWIQLGLASALGQSNLLNAADCQRIRE
jgi:hypothetical protein